MIPNRRRLLVAASALVLLGGAGAGYAYRRLRRHRNELGVLGDGGQPVISFRIPDAALLGLDAIPETMALGAGLSESKVTLYEFFDYNCPECRLAAGDLVTLARSDPALRVVLVNNPIVSAASAQAASVTIAVRKAAGSKAAAGLYDTLFAARGRIDAARALDAATASGLDREAIERLMVGEDVQQALRLQMQAAKDLGLFATPAYILGNAALIGHPGPEALRRLLAAMRACDRVACG